MQQQSDRTFFSQAIAKRYCFQQISPLEETVIKSWQYIPLRGKIETRYTENINASTDVSMTIKELLIQEIDSTPDELLSDILNLVRSLKSSPHSQINIYEQLLERIDYLEAIIGIRKGLESFERGEGISAEQAMTALQQQFNIPPRP